MELIRISDSKLKIMLSREDMMHYAISPERMDYENTETRRVVWQMLDEAKQKTGFDAAIDRVLIQVYPSRSGGCEMYVTKLPSKGEGEEAVCAVTVKKPGRPMLYTFETLQDLLQACRHLHQQGHIKNSAAYLMPEGMYHLLLWEERRDGIGGMPLYNPADEFGERQKGNMARLCYIKEHGTHLAEEGAIEKLLSLLSE